MSCIWNNILTLFYIQLLIVIRYALLGTLLIYDCAVADCQRTHFILTKIQSDTLKNNTSVSITSSFLASNRFINQLIKPISLQNSINNLECSTTMFSKLLCSLDITLLSSLDTYYHVTLGTLCSYSADVFNKSEIARSTLTWVCRISSACTLLQ